MANKLKNMQLTSVDLVRAGANQEADICLFKSAEEPEAPKTPTEPEKNILKRFIDWLNKNPQEAEIEAENTIEKANETAELYKDAITKSIQSIVSDETLTPEQKNTMIEKSLGQYHEKMAEIAKANPYHDSRGRFTTASGGGAGPAIPDMVGYMSQGMTINSQGNVVPDGSHQKPDPNTAFRNQCKQIASSVSGKAISGTISSKKIEEAKERGGRLSNYEGKNYFTSPQTDGTITAYTGKKNSKGGLDLENYATGFTDVTDARMWGIGTILNSVGKSYDTIDEVEKSYEEIEEVAKFNPYHGKDGRFASKNGGTAAAGSGAPSSGGATSNAEFKKQVLNQYKEVDKLEAKYQKLGEDYDKAYSELDRARRAYDTKGEKKAQNKLDSIHNKVKDVEDKLWEARGKLGPMEREAYERGIVLA